MEINLFQAILLGLCACLSSMPGLGGTTFGNYTLGRPLVAGLVVGLILGDIQTGVIVGASIFYPILELDLHQMMSFNWVAFAVGFVVSFISGFFCIKYFLKFLGKHSMKVFAYYCWVAGIFMFVFFKFFA